MTTETMASLSEKKREIHRLRAELYDKNVIIAALETDRQSNQGKCSLVVSATKFCANKDIDCCLFALAMIDKAKEVLGNIDSIAQLREENSAALKESQRVSKELEAVKLELSKAKEELTSLANENANAMQDLKDQLSRRQDESIVVYDKLLGKPFSNLYSSVVHLFILFVYRMAIPYFIFLYCSAIRLWG